MHLTELEDMNEKFKTIQVMENVGNPLCHWKGSSTLTNFNQTGDGEEEREVLATKEIIWSIFSLHHGTFEQLIGPHYGE